MSKCRFILIFVSCNVTYPANLLLEWLKKILLKFVLVFFVEILLLIIMHYFTTLLIFFFFFFFFFFAWECLMWCIVLCKKVVRHLILAGHEVHVVSAAPEFVFTSAIQSPRLIIRKVNLIKAYAWLRVISSMPFNQAYVSYQFWVSIPLQLFVI